MGYLANFMVYTFAMVGVISIALLVFKSTTSGGCVSKSKYLKLVDTMSIGPRKTLHIISTGNEKFLIASDVDKTCLISKLELTENNSLQNKKQTNKSQTKNSTKENLDELVQVCFRDTMQRMSIPTLEKKHHVGIDSSILKIKSQENNSAVMKNMLEKLRV